VQSKRLDFCRAAGGESDTNPSNCVTSSDARLLTTKSAPVEEEDAEAAISTVLNPAARADCNPRMESSMAMQRRGTIGRPAATESRSTATRYESGAGLPAVTSSAATIAVNTGVRWA